jgi:hypothetical protein
VYVRTLLGTPAHGFVFIVIAGGRWGELIPNFVTATCVRGSGT